jgi:glutamate dehydrogenase
VAGQAGRPVDDVGALHFLIGGRLHLHWLRDRIAELPRGNRWEAMARAALRDDLFSLHAELTADVLSGGPAEGEADARLDGWLAANAQPVERCLGILGDITTTGTYDLTTLPVALREVRTLIQSTTPVAGNGAAPRPAAAAAVTKAVGAVEG